MIAKGVILPLLLVVVGMVLIAGSVQPTAAVTIIVHNPLALLGAVFLFAGMLFPFYEEQATNLAGRARNMLQKVKEQLRG